MAGRLLINRQAHTRTSSYINRKNLKHTKIVNYSSLAEKYFPNTSGPEEAVWITSNFCKRGCPHNSKPNSLRRHAIWALCQDYIILKLQEEYLELPGGEGTTWLETLWYGFKQFQKLSAYCKGGKKKTPQIQGRNKLTSFSHFAEDGNTLQKNRGEFSCSFW